MQRDVKSYAHMPLKQKTNRVWRTYEGGALIDRWKREPAEADGSFPEEWIMSAISARGKGRPANEGLSILNGPEGEISLKELINSDPKLFLGKRIAESFGTTAVLIKMLDSKERLTIQVHPDKQYAREILGSQFGKTESWYVLGGREIEGEESCIYLGFKEGITKEIWKELFRTQDIEGMLNSLHKFKIEPGDAFMIYGGVPHAIGAGCFLLEVQEPTDYTMRVEKVTPAGLVISEELIHQGVGEEQMLNCFSYDAYNREDALSRWKIIPQVVEEDEGYRLSSIFNKSHTDCFGVDKLELDGKFVQKATGSFYVAVVYEGEGIITYQGQDYTYGQGDELFFSAAMEEVMFTSMQSSTLLLCYPPL